VQWLRDENKTDANHTSGGETAAMPFAAWLAERMNKPFMDVRKKPAGQGLTCQPNYKCH
jgi:orotate phosphoribosyltransferase